MILKMIKFAEEKHRGQVRKGSGDPYFTHPVAVSYLVATYKKSKKIKELITVCHGHDLLEDTDTTFEELVENFGPLVASLIFELTNDEKEMAEVGKFEYHKRKFSGLSNYGLIIKLCDRLHNVTDNPTPKYLMDTVEILRYVGGRRKWTNSQLEVVHEIMNVCDTKLRAMREEEYKKAWANV